MRTRHSLTIFTIVGFLALLAVGFGIQQHVTTVSFDKLESKQTAEHAQRVSVALEYETQLLHNYGATNSIWDNSYNDGVNADEDSFDSDFEAGDLKDLYGLDGVAGVRLDGTVVTGGLAASENYAPLPSQLADPSLTKKMFDASADPGTGKCGLVNAGAPYVFCGFPSYKGDSTGPVQGGLIFFKTLDASGLKAFGARSGLSISQVQTVGSGEQPSNALNSQFGEIKVLTTPLSDRAIAVDLEVPVVNSDQPVIFRVERDRPIHEQASKTETQMGVLIGAIGLSLLIVVVILQKFVVEARVRKLRRTIDEIRASNDQSMRVTLKGADEIGMLAKSFNEMLVSNSEQKAAIDASQATQDQANQRAQQMVTETSANVVAELDSVVADADRVSQVAGVIDGQVSRAAEMTQQASFRAADASAVVDALANSTQRIEEITRVIATIAGQTNLLALNATIEAARAGAAGKGFAVVASEVKSLATLTAESTDAIADSIASIKHDAEAVSAVVSHIVSAINGINSTTSDIVGATEEQRSTVAALCSELDKAVEKIRALGQRPGPSAAVRFGANRNATDWATTLVDH